MGHPRHRLRRHDRLGLGRLDRHLDPGRRRPRRSHRLPHRRRHDLLRRPHLRRAHERHAAVRRRTRLQPPRHGPHRLLHLHLGHRPRLRERRLLRGLRPADHRHLHLPRLPAGLPLHRRGIQSLRLLARRRHRHEHPHDLHQHPRRQGSGEAPDHPHRHHRRGGHPARHRLRHHRQRLHPRTASLHPRRHHDHLQGRPRRRRHDALLLHRL